MTRPRPWQIDMARPATGDKPLYSLPAPVEIEPKQHVVMAVEIGN